MRAAPVRLRRRAAAREGHPRDRRQQRQRERHRRARAAPTTSARWPRRSRRAWASRRTTVLTASTGAIGTPLPVDRIAAAVPALVAALGDDVDPGGRGDPHHRPAHQGRLPRDRRRRQGGQVRGDRQGVGDDPPADGDDALLHHHRRDGRAGGAAGGAGRGRRGDVQHHHRRRRHVDQRRGDRARQRARRRARRSSGTAPTS